jgi:transcriptional regulator with XRE-family HTH domain
MASDFMDNITILQTEQGLTNRELGERIGVTPQQIHNLRRQPNITLRTMERLAGALGYEVKVELYKEDE